MGIQSRMLIVIGALCQCLVATAGAQSPPGVILNPPNFQPPDLSAEGISQINAEIKKLHYPFAVLVYQSLSNGDAATTINAWYDSQTSEDFAAGTTSVFLLSYDPREFRLLPGKKWIGELKLENDALKQFTDKFTSIGKNDPALGIIQMMQAMDGYIFDRTDPAQVAKIMKFAAQVHQLVADTNKPLSAEADSGAVATHVQTKNARVEWFWWVATCGLAVIFVLLMCFVHISRVRKVEQINKKVAKLQQVVADARSRTSSVLLTDDQVNKFAAMKGETAKQLSIHQDSRRKIIAYFDAINELMLKSVGNGQNLDDTLVALDAHVSITIPASQVASMPKMSQAFVTFDPANAEAQFAEELDKMRDARGVLLKALNAQSQTIEPALDSEGSR